MSSPTSLRWTACIPFNPQTGGSKTKNNRVSSTFTWRKSATKLLVWIVSIQCYKAFTGLSIRAKMVRMGRPLLRETLAETDHPSSKTPISNQYSLVA